MSRNIEMDESTYWSAILESLDQRGSIRVSNNCDTSAFLQHVCFQCTHERLNRFIDRESKKVENGGDKEMRLMSKRRQSGSLSDVMLRERTTR